MPDDPTLTPAAQAAPPTLQPPPLTPPTATTQPGVAMPQGPSVAPPAAPGTPAANLPPSLAGATGQAIDLNPFQTKGLTSGLSNAGQSFSNLQQAPSDLSAFQAIYGPNKSSMPGPSTPTMQPAIPSVPSPALGSVSAANTTINPVNVNLASTTPSSISDRNAKTNIRSAKRDVYDFLNSLNARK